jgi:hypothetical protein
MLVCYVAFSWLENSVLFKRLAALYLSLEYSIAFSEMQGPSRLCTRRFIDNTVAQPGSRRLAHSVQVPLPAGL